MIHYYVKHVPRQEKQHPSNKCLNVIAYKNLYKYRHIYIAQNNTKENQQQHGESKKLWA